MGRAGRYTLSVMAWIAAFAGWSSIVGLVVAAITGGEADGGVSAATSALFYVIGPLVPTIVALWFNDWARDGFPTREQRREQARAAQTRAAQTRAAQTRAFATAPPAAADEALTSPAPEGAAPAFVTATPLGVPEAATSNDPANGGFPVAPLLRDRRDLDSD
jgi:hypothetical protein